MSAERVELQVPFLDDWHVHLRQGEFCDALTRRVLAGGARRVLVMPNLSPPVLTAASAIAYHRQLRKVAPDVEFFMTLYLHSELSPEDLEAPEIQGVKLYPRGVTTGSDQGVDAGEDLSCYSKVFSKLVALNKTLHIHGEEPTSSVLQAEVDFLAKVEQIRQAHPDLKIVLEHVTTKEAVDYVMRHEKIAATITVHHLDLTIDHVVNNSFNFCKPVAKTLADRDALRDAVSHERFFLGSDSAPHPRERKLGACCAAGIYTSAFLALYLVDLLDRINKLHLFEPFCCTRGAKFLGVSNKTDGGSFSRLTFTRIPFRIPHEIVFESGDHVVPFRAGETLNWAQSL